MEAVMDAAPPPKPAFCINLFKDGFALDGSEHQYYWRSALGEELQSAIDHCLLTPGLANLVSDLPIEWKQGTVLAEVRDYRHDRDSEPPPYNGLPRITCLRLQRSYQTLLHDLENAPEFQNLNEADLLQAEAALVNSFNAICLDPSPEAHFVIANAHYNKQKWNFEPGKSASSLRARLVPKRKRMRSSGEGDGNEDNPASSKRPKLSLVTFLNKIGQPTHVALEDPMFQRQQIGISAKLHPPDPAHPAREVTARPLIKVEAQPPTEYEPPPETSALLQRRGMIRIKLNKEFVYFEVIPKPNGCYDGRMRVGSDANSPGEYSERFALGNTEQTLSFIQNLRDLEHYEAQQEAAKLRQQQAAQAAQAAQAQAHGQPSQNWQAKPPPGAVGRGVNPPGHPGVPGMPGAPMAAVPQGGRRLPGQAPGPPGMSPQVAQQQQQQQQLQQQQAMMQGRGAPRPGAPPGPPGPMGHPGAIPPGASPRGPAGKGPAGKGPAPGAAPNRPPGMDPNYPGGAPIRRPGPQGPQGAQPMPPMPGHGMPPGPRGPAGKGPGAMPPGAVRPMQGMPPVAPPGAQGFPPMAGRGRGRPPNEQMPPQMPQVEPPGQAVRKTSRQVKKRKRDDDDSSYG